MKKIKLTESQLVSLIKKTVSRIIKEDEDMGVKKFPHNREEMSGYELTSRGELFLNFNYPENSDDDTEHTDEVFEITYSAGRFSPGSPATYEHPGDNPNLEVIIDDVFQTHPEEKGWEVSEFKAYMNHLGILDDIMNEMEMKLLDDRMDNGPEYDDYDDD